MSTEAQRAKWREQNRRWKAKKEEKEESGCWYPKCKNRGSQEIMELNTCDKHVEQTFDKVAPRKKVK